jgi:isocitrate dehydrogenase kinase/phosphatase
MVRRDMEGDMAEAGNASRMAPAPLHAGDPRVARCARAVFEAFRGYDAGFAAITRRAAGRFERREWAGCHADTAERLDLWEQAVDACVAEMAKRLGPHARDRRAWHLVKEVYGSRIEGFAHAELARTFFTSVSRRSFDTVGVDPLIEFVLDLEPRARSEDVVPTRIYVHWGVLEPLFREVLDDFRFAVPYADAERCVRRVCALVREACRRHYRGPETLLRVEMMTPVFYQSSRAFLVGRVDGEGWTAPLAIGVEHVPGGLGVEHVYMSEDDFSILFGFTRASFFVELGTVRGAVNFLRGLLPDKPVDELYSVLGRVRQGKTERFRYLARHLKRSRDVFVPAPGDKGLVMLVFTLPSYHLVFKVIRDRFGHSKTVTRQDVIDSYRLVSRHDRAGRLIDTQAFRLLEFPRDRFEPALLEELLAEGSRSVRLEGDRVVLDLVYIERKLRPLNLYLREASRVRVEAAVRDYGAAIKELAGINIFPGDMLLKNFGVTRHGRVIFYDFDEIALLTDCNFRTMPRARDDETALSDETWFEVGPRDVFPEQFEHFLGMSDELKRQFVAAHGDLLTPHWWRACQERARAGGDTVASNA